MKQLNSQTKRVTRILNATLTSLAVFMLICASSTYANPGSDNRAPDVPPTLVVGEGNKVSFHGSAIGFQIYGAMPSTNSPTGFAWAFVAPEAILYDQEGDVVAVHYAFAGPTRPAWESESGSRVVGARTVPGVTVDTNAIPWLVLNAVPDSTIGPGIFARTTFIQRVNTTGGLAPAAMPTSAAQIAKVPYTADYYFYREE
jgi:hypothetical protein